MISILYRPTYSGSNQLNENIDAPKNNLDAVNITFCFQIIVVYDWLFHPNLYHCCLNKYP